MSKAKKPSVHVAKVLRDAVSAKLDDPSGSSAFPVLSECLLPVYDGLLWKRQAGKLSISVEGAHWRVNLQCPTEGLQMTFVCETLVGVLEALEAFLASGRAVWTPGWNKHRGRLPTVDDIIQ
jgi:hypothetical protein